MRPEPPCVEGRLPFMLHCNIVLGPPRFEEAPSRHVCKSQETLPLFEDELLSPVTEAWHAWAK
jgi:hypothetical protein